VQGDVSGIPGATTDTATVSVTITAAANAPPTPAPPQCDLFSDGKCYHLIVGPTSQIFTKTVVPDSSCDITQPTAPCIYLDSVRSINIDALLLKPPVPPTDTAHELLFRIDSIDGLLYGCIPYSAFADVLATNPLPLTANGIGGPVKPTIGFGVPSVFLAIHHVFPGAVPDSFDERAESPKVLPTLTEMIDTISRSKSGTPYSFTFSSIDALPSSNITWLPDFPGCDNVSNAPSSGTEYGNVSVQLSFEVFQAIE
jgi:hypothetical protein